MAQYLYLSHANTVQGFSFSTLLCTVSVGFRYNILFSSFRQTVETVIIN